MMMIRDKQFENLSRGGGEGEVQKNIRTKENLKKKFMHAN